jgi:hypothetical protein
MELHVHDPSGRDIGRLPESELPLLNDLYDAGIGQTDEQIGRLLRRLTELGLDDNTIIILTADHGETLGEGGRAGHETLFDHILLVPLVLSYPGRIEGGARIRQQVRLIDLVPTILDLAGLAPVDNIDGESLWPLIRGEARATAREAWTYASKSGFGISLRISNRWKYILNNSAFAPLSGREELYNLEDDPGETVNLAETRSETEALRERVMEKLREAPGIKAGFVNGSEVNLLASLHWNDMAFRAVKFEGTPCGECVEWAREDGALRVTVPPGRTFTLSLEEVSPGQMTVLAGLGNESGPRSFSLDLDPVRLSTPVGRAFTGSSWVDVGADGSSEDTYVMIWHQGQLFGSGEAVEMDEATLQRLRALGYIQ